MLFRSDSDGSKQWTQLLGTNGYDSATSVSTADDGSVYVGGLTEGDLDGQTHSGGYWDGFISKFDSDGSKQWTQLLGTNKNDRAYSVSTADDGSVYVGGDGQTISGYWDGFISKFNSGGTPGGGNEAPVAEDDFLSLAAGSIKLADVLSNDSDPDGDELTITSISEIGRAHV